MKKSKITSQFKIIIIILFIISIIYTLYSLTNTPKSHYPIGKIEIQGIVENISENNITIKAKERLIVTTENFKGKLGDIVQVKGTLTKPKKNTIFNLFNYRNYLMSKKINYIVDDANIKIIKPNNAIHFTIKNNLIEHINKYKTKDYMNAFILGNTKEIEDAVYESYQTNGVSHLLAISGMHVTLLSLILLFILNKINKNKRVNYIITITILLFYAFLLNFTPSIVRAISLFICLTINKALNLKISSIYYLMLICSLYLYYNPYIVYNIGFLFSFTITAYLIIFSKIINNQNNYITKTFIPSLICFIASIPIMINNFHYLNLLSPLINLIFVPIISVIVYPLSLIALFIPPLDIPLEIILNSIEKISLTLSHITIFNLTLKHINITLIALYYLLITYILYNFKNKTNLIILLIVLLIHNNINYIENDLKITMIDVGQGDSTLITLPHNKGNILIDTGGLKNYKTNEIIDQTKTRLIPYLKSQGIKKIDYLILTHGDFDHAGNANDLISNFKVNNVIFNNDEYNELEKEIIKTLSKKKIKYYKGLKNLNVKKYKLQFLNTKQYDNENDNSNVIYFNYNNYKFLFMGDSGTKREQDILDKYNLNDIDFLKVGHHGSNTSSSKSFINTINPKYSLISVGKNNMYGHPQKEVLKTLSKTKIYRTDIDGSVKIKLNKKGYKIQTCRS